MLLTEKKKIHPSIKNVGLVQFKFDLLPMLQGQLAGGFRLSAVKAKPKKLL